MSRGLLHQADELPGLLAHEAGEAVGLLLHRADGDDCEVVALVAAREGAGAATALLERMRELAARSGWRRVWLVTTNDNARALAFFERRGLRRVAVHRGAVEAARRLKPEIPARGAGGVPIRDEIEYEL